MLSKFMTRMREVVLAKRWVLFTANGVLAVMAATIGLLDHTTWAAAGDFALAGFLLCSAMHALSTPGLMTTWREIERRHIHERMEEAFVEIMQRHHEDPDEPPTGKPN